MLFMLLLLFIQYKLALWLLFQFIFPSMYYLSIICFFIDKQQWNDSSRELTSIARKFLAEIFYPLGHNYPGDPKIFAQ